MTDKPMHPVAPGGAAARPRHTRRRWARAGATVVLGLLGACCWATGAWARLGGAAQTLDSERVALQANAHRIEHRALYDVHYLVRDDGEIRQYSDHAGRIFAVAWQTHLPVGLADLLEAPAGAPVAVTAGTSAGPASTGRHSASMVAGDRVVHVVKMSHLYMGTAQLTTRIPQGVDTRELR